ncbi:hypothetical protein Trydic_g22564 [Trypoxylus dichotomus]
MHLVELIFEITIQPTDLLVSFEATSLFTQVPIPDSLNFIEELLEQVNKSPDLARLIDKSLTSIYFAFQGEFFKQISGAAVGFSFSPVVANIFLESFESDSLENLHLTPKVSRVSLNTLTANILMEVEKYCVIPFLDVFVIQKPNGRLHHPIYGKPTHTDRYRYADSHHHPAQKLSVVNSLVPRAVPISGLDNLPKKLQHVKLTLQNNGYQCRNIREVVNKHLHPSYADKPQDSKNSENTAYLSFIHGVTERIS